MCSALRICHFPFHSWSQGVKKKKAYFCNNRMFALRFCCLIFPHTWEAMQGQLTHNSKKMTRRSETQLVACDGDVPSTGCPTCSALPPGVEQTSQLPHEAEAAPEVTILVLSTYMCLPGLTFSLEETHHFHLCLLDSWPDRLFQNILLTHPPPPTALSYKWPDFSHQESRMYYFFAACLTGGRIPRRQPCAHRPGEPGFQQCQQSLLIIPKKQCVVPTHQHTAGSAC